MTVEMATFYRRILSVGLTNAYQQDIEHALETEETLSDLLLDLAYCLSDTNKTITILDNYIDGRTPDENVIYPMILSEMQSQYYSDSLNLGQVADALFAILDSTSYDYSGPWKELLYLSLDYDDAKNGRQRLDDFLTYFADFFLAKHRNGEAL